MLLCSTKAARCKKLNCKQLSQLFCSCVVFVAKYYPNFFSYSGTWLILTPRGHAIVSVSSGFPYCSGSQKKKSPTQPSPQAFSARSILDSTVSCDVTERSSPRTPSQYCQIKYGCPFVMLCFITAFLAFSSTR